MAYNNPQDRSAQPGRAGGNSAKKVGADSGSHDSPRGEEIASTPSQQMGKASPGRRAFRGHGDSAGMRFHGNAPPTLNPGDVTIEKHDQPKDQGEKYVGGKSEGKAPEIPSNIQLSGRRHGGGNADLGDLSEPAGKAKRATRLNMDVSRFE